VITDNGEDCLKVYPEQLHDLSLKTNGSNLFHQPFDAVIQDYNMPRINGMEVAKEILVVNPHQRIIFASAYVKETRRVFKAAETDRGACSKAIWS
jgi:CheY-like chemotaxis protein